MRGGARNIRGLWKKSDFFRFYTARKKCVRQTRKKTVNCLPSRQINAIMIFGIAELRIKDFAPMKKNEPDIDESIAVAAEANAPAPRKKFVFKSPTKRQIKHLAAYSAFILLGNAIAAAATAFFVVPNGFVMGGTTGIGILVRNLLESNGTTGDITDWAVNLTVYIANIALFIVGAVFMGKKYAAATLAGSLLYPAFMSAYVPLNKLYVNSTGHPMGVGGEFGSPMLALVFGSILFGLGLGIVVRVGASTGGTDIPPMIMHKYFNLPVSATMIVLDCSIVALQLIAPQVDLNIALCGILITVFSSMMVEKVSLVGMRKTQVKIISKKYKEIREMILTEMNRGVTLLYGKSGFLQEKCFVIMTVVSNREVVKLKNEVWSIDPSAFLTISVISEVRGNGFTTDEKIALPKQQMHELEDVTEQFEKANTPEEAEKSILSTDTPSALDAKKD